MGYQSEAELEDNLIKKLTAQKYSYAKIEDYNRLEENFRIQINKFNRGVLNGKELSDTEFGRLINYLSGKSVFQCAKQLKDLLSSKTPIIITRFLLPMKMV